MRHPLTVQLVAVAASAALLASSAAAPLKASAQGPPSQIPREFGAPGAPVVDPGRCDAIPGIIDRMTRGLPMQQRWIESTERQLRQAREGKLESEADRRLAFLQGAVGFANKLVEQVTILRRSLTALNNLSPAAASKRLTLLQQIETIQQRASEFQLALGAGVAFADYREIVRRQMDDLQQLAILAQDTGVTDTLVTWGANAAMPVLGPLVVEAGTVMRDYFIADWQVELSESEMRDHNRNLLDMQNAVRNQEIHIRALKAERAACASLRPRSEAEQKPEPICAEPPCQTVTLPGAPPATQWPELPPPPAEPPPVPEKKGRMGMGETVTIGLLGAAAAGLAVAASQINVEDPAGTDDTGGSNNSGGGMTVVSHTAGGFQCTFNSAGIINNCAATITVNIQANVAVGSSIRLQTRNFGIGDSVITTRNPPGQTTFDNMRGPTGTSTCPGPVTRLDLIHNSTGVIIASATGFSIPMTCR